MNWQPTSSLANLQQRAKLLTLIRNFFAERQVLEVETPLLCQTTATDPHINSFYLTPYQRYLQTSPEYAMKRLLAAGSGSIYQICKVFRDDEIGRWHNPEFTMLEWYRVNFNDRDLMQEVDQLLQTVLNSQPAEKYSYQELFLKYLNIDPHRADLMTLQKVAEQQGLDFSQLDNLNRDDWLQLLLNHCIEPHLGFNRPTFIYDFPASQAALARLKTDDVAARFEVYVNGIELANGYHELTDPQEQQQRFLKDIAQRQQLSYPKVPIDNRLLAALNAGLPNCAGVALGLDRLFMIATQAQSIHQVLSFDWHHC